MSSKTEKRVGLEVGDVIKWKPTLKSVEKEWVVTSVCDSSATIAPLDSPIIWRHNPSDGRLQFLPKGDDVDHISANSEIEVLRSLGRKGLQAHIEGNKTKTQRTETMAKDKKDKAPKVNTGKLGGYKGHSITSVIRAFGKAGWSLDEARAFFAKHEIEVADTTIKIQLRAGVKGEGGDPAKFSKDELAAMRPKVAKKNKDKDKPAKSKKSKPAPKEDEDEDDEKPAAEEGEEEAEDEAEE